MNSSDLLGNLIVLAIAAVLVVMVVKDIKQGGVVGFAMLGAVVGAVVGFLLRPSVPFVGQLPLDVVLSRGASLNGIDQLLRSIAEQSFNYVIIGAVLGVVVVAGAKGIVLQRPSTAATQSSAPPPSATDAQSASTSSPVSTFCTKCGIRLVGQDVVFCGSCGARLG
jgi:hypothetical protein